jgi:hypothetical protein
MRSALARVLALLDEPAITQKLSFSHFLMQAAASVGIRGDRAKIARPRS